MTVCRRPEPSTWVTAGISARFSSRIWKTCIMNGTSSSSSNQSATASSQHRRRERPERFAPLDLGVEDLLHVGAARIADDRAVAERARPPFHAALKPADDLAVGDRRGGAPAELGLVGDFLDRAAGRGDLRSRCAASSAAMSSASKLRAPIGVVHDEARARRRAGATRANAAPIAPPASPAAACT